MILLNLPRTTPRLLIQRKPLLTLSSFAHSNQTYAGSIPNTFFHQMAGSWANSRSTRDNELLFNAIVLNHFTLENGSTPPDLRQCGSIHSAGGMGHTGAQYLPCISKSNPACGAVLTKLDNEAIAWQSTSQPGSTSNPPTTKTTTTGGASLSFLCRAHAGGLPRDSQSRAPEEK